MDHQHGNKDSINKRGDISIITEYTNGNTTNKMRRKLKTMEPLTDAECAILGQKLWNTSHQGAKH